MELSLSLKQQLTPQQLQRLELLQFSTLELEQYLQMMATENPVIDPEPSQLTQDTPSPESTFSLRTRWLEETDYQNRYYRSSHWDSSAPFDQRGSGGGLEETLSSFLSRQLPPLNLPSHMEKLVEQMILCLDEDGYFRIPLAELASEWNIPLFRLATALNFLRGLEPAGVGAENLSQCLELQLKRAKYSGLALDIVRNHLDALSKHHYRELAKRLSVSVEEIHHARQVIRALNPRPGAIFAPERQTPYILPDLYVTEVDGILVIRPRQEDSIPFRINPYYHTLSRETTDEETKTYLSEKLRQAEELLEAIQHRESTLLRCVQAITAHQRGFFQKGEGHLLPLSMKTIAAELDLHESTVSRAIREKYLQCSHGIFPLRFFFSSGITDTTHGEQPTSSTAIKALLRRLIQQEDPSHPLSDQKLSEELARLGCPVSRRTTAKYREEMKIPGTLGRKLQP